MTGSDVPPQIWSELREEVVLKQSCNSGAYNAPSTNKIGTFEECQADNALNPGLFVENGVSACNLPQPWRMSNVHSWFRGPASTYSQPPESLGPISVCARPQASFAREVEN